MISTKFDTFMRREWYDHSHVTHFNDTQKSRRDNLKIRIKDKMKYSLRNKINL